MIEKLPYVNESVSVINKYGSIIIKNDTNSLFLTSNEAALATLRECNGTNTLQQIIIKGVEKYSGGQNINSYIDQTVGFFSQLYEIGCILYSDTPVDVPLRLIDVPDICYPNNIVFELTDFCNLNCKYCYRESDSGKSSFMDTNRFLSVLKKLSKYGLQSVHLTGGEPGMHPDFITILLNALKFSQKVIILSNGTSFDKNVLKIFEEYKQRILVQVDIDGPNEAVHDEIRGVNGSFAAVTSFAKEAAALGIPVEIAMNVCNDNFDTIEQTIVLSKELGAIGFTCTPVMELGRGKNVAVLNEEQTASFIQMMPKLNENFSGLINIPEATMEDIEKRRNCGGGHRNLVCSPDGRIRPCVLLPPEMYVMGNLFEDDPDELFARPVFKHFANLQAPNSETCGNCTFSKTCLGCFSKVLLMEDKMRETEPGFTCGYKEHILF